MGWPAVGSTAAPSSGKSGGEGFQPPAELVTLQRLQLGCSFAGYRLLQGSDLLGAGEALDSSDAGVSRSDDGADYAGDAGVQLGVLDDLFHQSNGECRVGIESLVGHQHPQRATYADQAGECEGGATVGHQAHSSKCGRKRGTGSDQAHVARQPEVEAEARGGTLNY